MQLDGAKSTVRRQRQDLFGRHIHADRYRLDARRQMAADIPGLTGRQVTRAFREKHQADGVGTHPGTGQGFIRTGQPADLDLWSAGFIAGAYFLRCHVNLPVHAVMQTLVRRNSGVGFLCAMHGFDFALYQ
jgi:hypothetical protein